MCPPSVGPDGAMEDPAAAKPRVLPRLAASVIVHTRPALVQQLSPNSGAAAKWLGSTAAASTLLAFMCTPGIGAASDRYGRKPLMLLSALSGAIRALPALQPSLYSAAIERFVSVLADKAMMGTCFASLADCTTSAELSAGQGILNTAIGSACVLAPLVGTQAHSVAGPRGGFTLAAVLAALSTAITVLMPETLAPENRSPLKLRSMMPDSFLRIFTAASPARLAGVLVIQALVDIPGWGDMSNIFMQEDLGLSGEGVGAIMSGIGVSMAAGGMITPPLINLFGERKFTSLAHALGIMGFLCWSRATRKKPWLMLGASLPLLAVQWSRSNAIRAAAVPRCEEHLGMGKGEASAATSALESVAAVAAPLLFGSVYATGVKRGRPHLPFELLAGLLVLAELMCGFLRRSDLETGTELELPLTSKPDSAALTAGKPDAEPAAANAASA